MSYVLETINGGKVGEFGYLGPLVTSVGLGELPRMPIDQFCDFGVAAMLTSWRYIKADQRMLMIASLNSAAQTLEGIGPMRPEYLRFLEDLLSTQPYSESPFKVGTKGVDIGNHYLVDHPDYALFAGYVLVGGSFGWNPSIGVPRPIPGAIDRVLGALR